MRSRSIATRARLTAPLLVLCLLGGCSMLNGNVKGNFACRAPDGTCAPTSRIDDAAVALLVGETADEARPESLTATTRAVGAPLRRSGEKVLRIMFPAYIDDRGRLHEASAIHAVVESGDWVPAGEVHSARDAAPDLPPASQAPAGLGGAALSAPVLPLGGTTSLVDPDAPTSAQIEAARARKPVSVEEVRTKVEALLSPPKVPDAPSAAPAAVTPSPVGEAGAAPRRAPGLPGAPEED